MKISFLLLTGAAVAAIGPVIAGTLELQPKETAPPAITQGEPWQFTIAVPGLMPGIDGTIGIRGVNADIDVGFDQILQHLDMMFAMRAEARKDRFGMFGEIFYSGLSDGAQIGGLINNVHEQVDQYLIDVGLSWRFINQPRWFIDFAAGTHYASVYEQLTLNSDPTAIHQASQQFVDDVAADLRGRLDTDISKNEFLAALKHSIRDNILERIGNRLGEHERHPNIPIGPLGGRIREKVAEVVEDLIQLKLDVLRTRIDALHLQGEARRAAVNRMVNAAKARIADQVSVVVNSKLDQTLSRQDGWFDPYVGLHTRYNFNRTFYTALRGEIGGFGVGADLMWQVEGVLGINLTHCIFSEVGYRALGSDYNNDGLLLDTVLHGPQITTGVTF